MQVGKRFFPFRLELTFRYLVSNGTSTDETHPHINNNK